MTRKPEMADQDSRWSIEWGLGVARLEIHMVGDHLDELPDPVVIEHGAQLLHAVATEEGARSGNEIAEARLWWVTTSSAHQGVVIARDIDEAERRWLLVFPDTTIASITGPTLMAAYI